MIREKKHLGAETHPGEGVVKEEKFPQIRKPSHEWGQWRALEFQMAA